MTFKVAAFGALNQDSYDIFAEWLHHFAGKAGIALEVVSACPYPNKEAVSAPGRPLRAEALLDEEKRQQLFVAAAGDGKKIGADESDISVMPCMSMIGFHDGVEKALGRRIMRLSEALAEKYKNIDKIGIIPMRPARKNLEALFGNKAVMPDEKQSAQLLAAEEEAKKIKNAAPVEAVMKEITEAWRELGLKYVLFARADAPKAQKGPAGQVKGITINSTFDILAEAVVRELSA
jgi:hypothetical protein